MVTRPKENGELLEGSDEFVWAKYLTGTFTIKAGIRGELESRLKRKYHFTAKQFSEFGFELIRRAGLGTNPPELPPDAKYDLSEEQRRLLTAMIEMLSRGKAVREREQGESFATAGSRKYLMEETAYARQNKCPKCVSRDKKPKVSFPSEEQAKRFSELIRAEKGSVQIVYRCPYEIGGWHLKSSRPFRGTSAGRGEFQDPMADVFEAAHASAIAGKFESVSGRQRTNSKGNDGEPLRNSVTPNQVLNRCPNCGWEVQASRMASQPCPFCGSKAHLTKVSK